MSENGRNETENESDGGGLGGMLLMIAFLDILLLGVALYAFSLGEPTVAAGILILALLLTGIDVWLYRRGSF
jgi:cbb3-type cytochrome oxidase subunit 3